MKLSKTNIKKLLSGGLMLGLVGVAGVMPASAAQLTTASVTLNTNRPSGSQSVAGTYTFAFESGSAMTQLGCVEVVFSTSANTFAGGANTPTGLDNVYNASNTTVSAFTVQGTDNADTSGIILVNDYTIRVTNSDVADIAVSNDIVLAFNNMTNPSGTGTYFARVRTGTDADCTGVAAGTYTDQAVVSFSINGGTVVSATVDPSFTFAVSLIGDGVNVKGSNPYVTTSTGCTGSGTAVNFPAPLSGTMVCAQQLRVNTNAAAGYGITLRGIPNNGAIGSGFLQSGPTNAIADTAGTNASPTAWGSPAGSQFGYTTNNIPKAGNLSGGNVRFAGLDTFAQVDMTAREVGFNDGPTTNGDTNLAYKLVVAGSQPAGNYSGTVIYVATPVF